MLRGNAVFVGDLLQGLPAVLDAEAGIAEPLERRGRIDAPLGGEGGDGRFLGVAERRRPLLPLPVVLDRRRITSYNVCYTKLLRQVIVHIFDPFPVNFRDMQQSFFSGEDFNKCAECDNALYFSIVDFSDFRYGHDPLDPLLGGLYGSFVQGEDIDHSEVTHFLDHDGRVSFFLDLLGDASTRSDHCADEFFRSYNFV